MEWYAVVMLVLVFLGGGTVTVLRFMGLTKEQKYESVQAWLLQAVLLAEREFGSGTGKLKLSVNSFLGWRRLCHLIHLTSGLTVPLER